MAALRVARTVEEMPEKFNLAVNNKLFVKRSEMVVLGEKYSHLRTKSKQMSDDTDNRSIHRNKRVLDMT